MEYNLFCFTLLLVIWYANQSNYDTQTHKPIVSCGSPKSAAHARQLHLKCDLAPNGWDRLVGGDQVVIEVLREANHFNMPKNPAVKGLTAFIAKAMA